MTAQPQRTLRTQRAQRPRKSDLGVLRDLCGESYS
jgi:hypothetical protein